MITRIAAWLCLIAIPLSAQVSLPFGMKVDPNVSMRIWVPSGKVRVDTWDRDSIRVTGTVAVHAHLFAGGGGRGAKMGVESDKPDDTSLPSADIVVTVPRKAHVWIKMTDGAVTAVNTSGELEIYTVTGSVMVRDASGITSVEAIDGTITLAGVSGDLRVRGGGGKVTLSQIHATMSVSTISGDVELATANLQDAHVETIGGAITVQGSVVADALVDLETHSGAIALVIDRNAVPALSLTSRGGTITNALGAAKGTAGQIVAHSFKGNINVTALTGIEGKKVGTPP